MKTYKASDAHYAIGKLVKACRNREMNDPRTVDHLEVIWLFAKNCRMGQLMTNVLTVMDYLTGQSGMPADTLWKTLMSMKYQIERAKENILHMKRLENSARDVFFVKKRSTKKESLLPDKLQRYDVIKIPTPGGFHYSIVATVTDDYVSCYPTTTASRTELEHMGCRSLSLNGSGLEGFRGTRITTSEVKIPIENAKRSYKGSVAGNPFIANALARIETLSSTVN